MTDRNILRARLIQMLRAYAAEVMTPGSDRADPGEMADRVMLLFGGSETHKSEDPIDLGKADLKQLMRDPRYWKYQDPVFVEQVREGFRKLYHTENAK